MPPAVTQALARLGGELRVPELEHAPLLMMGFSRTGSKAVRFAVHRPERTVSVFFGGGPGITLGITDKNPEVAQRAHDALRALPCVTVSGSQDAFVGINPGAKRGYFDWELVHYPKIRAARLQTLHAAWMIDRHGASAARDEISAIKFSVAATMLRAVDTAIQVHGALGVTDDTVLAHWYRHERAARIYDGADEVHKTTLGRRILRRYAAA